MPEKTFRVIKAVAGKFVLEGCEGTFHARGNFKRDRIVSGDYVCADGDVITRVCERKNKLVRPNVANVDLIAVVLASVPAPDFNLVDKMLIYAENKGIDVVLIVNKADLADAEFLSSVKFQYDSVCDVLTVCARTGDGIERLKAYFAGRLTVFCGQSAVGKSTLLNALCGEEHMETGEVGERSGRGRHTTRHAEIFCADGLCVVDTPGFSELYGEELEMTYEDCDYYYPEFFALSKDCRFNRCTHTHEPDCAVKLALSEGKLSQARYDRYLKLREELKAAKKY